MREEIGDRKRAFWAGGPMEKHRDKKGWQSVGPAKSSTWLELQMPMGKWKQVRQ